ncbi:hypothetical protein NUM_22460 [Actinocatenispora comari]|uniref:NurA domain-containing protein n=1 Tax=Actinocatenispora comari TaxID=2807577 RepID=A0A8J4EJC1_9ACTN|nr:hypothetical protein NUM_22460 [Actinocatenispora comari]
MHVDAWDPSYGRSFEADAGGAAGPAAASSAPVDAAVERPTGAWAPLTPPGAVRSPHTVLLVDGVRRIDARVWVEDDEGVARPGVCASYAAGAVRCDLAGGAAELALSAVTHGLFAPGPSVAPLRAHDRAVYVPHRVVGDDPSQVDAELQRRLYELEVQVSQRVRAEAGSKDDLLVVDGPLRGRTGMPRTLGYAKTHHKQYLDGDLTRVVTALAPGQRTPLFLLGGQWHRYSWYLRLPAGATSTPPTRSAPIGSPWSGIVRLECPADWSLPDAIGWADLSAVTLPRFASTPYKDPRAPQNLVPIAGLERRLRGLLGDSRLLLRGLRTAAARTSTASTSAATPPAEAGAVPARTTA